MWKEGVLTPLIKKLTEAALEGELESHLGQEINANRRNGKSKKNIKLLNGGFELKTPRNRAGTFSPQLVKKLQTTLNYEIEEKIIALYGLGMSYKDISGQPGRAGCLEWIYFRFPNHSNTNNAERRLALLV